MSLIRILRTALRADTTHFKKGMKGARGTLKRFASAVKFGAVGVAALGAAMTFLAARALKRMVQEQAKAIDSMAKLAKITGISTEALAGLQLRAELTGADVETLNKGLIFMAKALGEAKSGIGEGKQALDSLGLSVEDLLGQKPDEQIKILADRFEGLATQEEKAFAASKLFGRAGVQLVNLLAGGSKQIEKTQKLAEELGLTFNEFDAAGVEAANDAMTKLGAMADGAARKITIGLAPAFAFTIEQLVKMATGADTFGKSMEEATNTGSMGLLNIANSSTYAALKLKELQVGFLALAKDIRSDDGGGFFGFLITGGTLMGDDNKLKRRYETAVEERTKLFHELAIAKGKAIEFMRALGKDGGSGGGKSGAPSVNSGLSSMGDLAKMATDKLASGLDVATLKAGNLADALNRVLESLANMFLQKGLQQLFGAALGAFAGPAAGAGSGNLSDPGVNPFAGAGGSQLMGVAVSDQVISTGINTSGSVQRSISAIAHTDRTLAQYRGGR